MQWLEPQTWNNGKLLAALEVVLARLDLHEDTQDQLEQIGLDNAKSVAAMMLCIPEHGRMCAHDVKEFDPDFGDEDMQLARRSTWRAEVELRMGSSRLSVSGEHFCDCSEHVAGRCTITAARSSLWSSKLVCHRRGNGQYCSQQGGSQLY